MTTPSHAQSAIHFCLSLAIAWIAGGLMVLVPTPLLAAETIGKSYTPSDACAKTSMNVVVLGSGGPELDDGRASSGYLLREGTKAVFLIDFGGGAAAQLEALGGTANATPTAQMINDLRAVMFTHFHVDHSADFPTLIKASFFSDRTDDLPVYAPDDASRYHIMPSPKIWLESLFGAKNGAYRYLSGQITPDAVSNYKIIPHAVSANTESKSIFRATLGEYQISAISAVHGPLPALSWRIERAGCAVVFSGDTSNRSYTLEQLAKGADLLIANNAVPENAGRVGGHLHMIPSEIGRIAQLAEPRSLLLSHFMNRSKDIQSESQKIIAEHYQGQIALAKDGMTIWLNRSNP